ncbi:MAG: acetylxylan esterase [Fimbriimonadaceae bacterium]|nr:acetylxylan esterase [Fimbriimonadaceae bacterium]
MLDRNLLPARYPRQLKDHFNRLSDELQLARGFAADRATWEARRPLVRQALIDAVGGFPERTPLQAEIVGTLERDGYSIEKLVYQSRPGFYVTGAVYRPHIDHPVPAIFCPHGHYAEGRFNAELQRRMVNHARRGYLALVIDKVGYNDRLAQDHSTRAPLLAGLATQGLQLWDNMRGIDYLLSRPEALSDRLGCTGVSGGGNQTMYLSALDERITASAPVCSVELGECYMHKRYCTCELVPGLRRFADLVDICGLIAPRALLLVHGILDFGFLIDSARKAYARIRQIYGALGVPERVAHYTSLDSHAYNREMREAVYDWFDLHLKGQAGPPAVEVEATVESPEDLRCLPQGLPGDAVNLLDLLAERAAGLHLAPACPPHRRAQLRHVLGGDPPPTPLRPHLAAAAGEHLGETAAQVELGYVYSEPDVVLPLALYRPAGEACCEVVIRFGPNGHGDVPEEAVAADLAAGRAVLLADLRGTGETRAEGDPSTAEWQAYLSSVTLGRPIQAMRAWDLRRLVDYCETRADLTAIHLAAHGTLLEGLVALLAAALDPRVASLTVAQLPPTFCGQASFGELATVGQLAVIPNLLQVGDVATLLELVAPRPVTVAQWVNLLGEPLASGA